MQEDDLVVPLAHGDVEVAHAAQPAGQLRELVEMGREEHLRSRGAIVQLLDDRPRDGQPVERGGPAADLVEQHEAARREVVEDRRRFDHLHEERRLAAGEVVLGADAREDPVDQADRRRARRHERAHLGQHHDVADLAQVDRLAGHVGTGQDHHTRLVVEAQIVGSYWQPRARLQHWMAALDDLEHAAGFDARPHVATAVGDLGERRRHVEQRERPRGAEQVGGPGGDAPAQLVEELVLQPAAPLLGAEHLRLVLLQLGHHVALGAGERLAPDVLGGRPGGLGVGELDAVAEDAIEADAQARQAGAGPLPLLEPGDPASRLGRVLDDRAQRVVPGVADDAAVLQRDGRLVHQRGLEGGPEVGQVGQRRPRAGEERRRQRDRRRADRLQRRQARPQSDEVAGVGHPERGAAREPGEVADRLQQPAYRRARVGRVDQRGDRVLAGGDGAGIEQRLEQPLAEQAGAHRRHGLVEHAEERVPRRSVARLEQLERPHGGLVERHAVGRLQPLQPHEVAETLALGCAEIRERRRGGRQPGAQVGHAERRERAHAEVRAKIGRGAPAVPERRIGERQRGAGRLQARQQVARRPLGLRQQHLGWAAQQRRGQHGILAGAVLADPELAGRDVEQRDRWRRRCGRRP